MEAVGRPGNDPFHLHFLSLPSCIAPHILVSLPGMILTWPSASTVDSAKRLVLLMPLLKVPTLSIRRKLMRLVGILYWSICGELDSIVYAIELNFKFCCRSFFMTKRSCLRMVIVGKLRLQRTSDLKAFTVNACWLILPS